MNERRYIGSVTLRTKIRRALWHTEEWAIDSFSTDRTEEIATAFGAKALRHEFKNRAQQLNRSIRNCNITADWIYDAGDILSRKNAWEGEEIPPFPERRLYAA